MRMGNGARAAYGIIITANLSPHLRHDGNLYYGAAIGADPGR